MFLSDDVLGCPFRRALSFDTAAKLIAPFLLIASRTQAETASRDANAKLSAPEALEVPVEYPSEARGESSVLLELTVDAQGQVREAKTLVGEAPFAEIARSAALGWRFNPAERDGKPVAARIRYTVRFVPPEPDPLDTTEASSKGPPDSDPKATPRRPRSKPLEIVVLGERRSPGSVIVTREEARSIPGTFGDPLRAIETQPGVVPIVSGLPAFFIRGAPPANVGFFLDGVDLPLLYHAFLGPSVVHPALVSNVQFYPGSAPVQYGRFAGPVVAVTPSSFQGRFSGEAALRIIDIGAFVEAPLSVCPEGAPVACRKSTARLAGRYSYTGLVLSLLSDTKLAYWDYLAHVEHELGANDTLSFLGFGAYDYFRAPQASNNSGGELSFHRFDLRWDHRISKRTGLRLALTAGYDRAAGAAQDFSVVKDHSLRGRLELRHQVNRSTTINAGFDARGDRFGLDTNARFLSYPDYSALFPARTDLVIGAYTDAEFQATPRIRLAPGVRMDLYRSMGTTAVGVDPRIASEITVSPLVRLDHSIGLAHQRPNFAAQVPGAQVADLAGGLQWAVLWSSGVKVALPEDFSAQVNVFRNAYFRALDPIGGARDFTIDRTVLERRATVSGAGIELVLARSLTKKLGGFLAYTLSRSEQSTGSQKSLSGFDRPHVLQAALGYEPSLGLRFGARGVFYSGIPELNLEGSPHFTSDRRGTAYFRLDVRAEKRWRLGNHAYWGLIAEVLNATSTREVIRLDCGEICRERVAGPVVLPSIGLEAGF